jgi:hypothetical protein
MKRAGKVNSTMAAQALLKRHACPVPFHEVRTRFLGNIATPALSLSPLAPVKNLWGGELPEFEDIDEANLVLEVLVGGLWNDLTRHQKRSQPFRISLLVTEPTIECLRNYALVRRQEVDGFIEGLFNGEDDIDLPERAHVAVTHLGEIRAMMAGVYGLRSDAPDLQNAAEIAQTLKALRDMSRIMEAEMNETVLSCSRARQHVLESVITQKPTFH